MASIVDTEAPSATPSTPIGDRRRAPVVVGVGTIAAAGLVALADPRSNHVPLCAVHATTGLDCPLCGGLRAVQSLVEGDIVTAADHNVLFVASIPILVLVWGIWLRRAATDPTGSLPASSMAVRTMLSPWLVPVGIGVLVAFAAARNLPALEWLDSR